LAGRDCGPRGRAHEQAPGSTKAEDAEFLVENFDIPIPTAADLVAGPEIDVIDVELATRKLEASHDPLKGVPVPKEPTSDLVSDNDEVRLKPVIRKKNKRRGAG
jgi:hypothetical protein